MSRQIDLQPFANFNIGYVQIHNSSKEFKFRAKCIPKIQGLDFFSDDYDGEALVHDVAPNSFVLTFLRVLSEKASIQF